MANVELAGFCLNRNRFDVLQKRFPLREEQGSLILLEALARFPTQDFKIGPAQRNLVEAVGEDQLVRVIDNFLITITGGVQLIDFSLPHKLRVR